MKINHIFIVYFIMLTSAYSQTEDSSFIHIVSEKDTIMSYTSEEPPEFPGGEQALIKYMNDYPYPASALENGIEGTVYIKFYVEPDGKTSGFEIFRGVNAILDSAALNHIINMPNEWKPGYQFGKPVRVQYIVPFRYNKQRYLERK